MMRLLVLAACIAVISSCTAKKPNQITLSETEAWELSYKMVKSSILDDTELGIKQFDSLLQSRVYIEPKILNTGLELLQKKGEYQRISNILHTASPEAKMYVCQKDWLAQHTSTEIKSICTGIEAKKEVVKNPELQKELAIMFYNDQAVRENPKPELLARFGLTVDSILYKLDMQATDAANREKLKSMIATYGFPDKSMVGEVGMESIFFIIQHADQDKEFQLAQFPYIEAAVKRGDLDGQKYAYLYDRIKVNAGEPQRYGTQFSRVDSETNTAELAPVEDIENLDKRRKEMGMMPISVYREIMLSFSKKQATR
jgi:hypothetical protein